MKRTIAPAAINALKEALTCVYWYKSDLRSFLQNSISDPAILARVNWDDYKRNIVATVVDYLARDQATYQGDLIRLMNEVVNIRDFSHLAKLDDGKVKAESAKRAVAALERLTATHRDLEEEQKQAEARRQAKHEELLRSQGVRDRLQQLQTEFFALLSERPQRRGYQLEKLLRELFDLFDLVDTRPGAEVAGRPVNRWQSVSGGSYGKSEGKWDGSVRALWGH
ncbi:MAG: hypothetical protein AB1941_30875, partial [Gemmatimonadota bacterium]